MKPTVLESGQVTTGENGEGAKILRLVPREEPKKGSTTSIEELVKDFLEVVHSPDFDVTRAVICYVTTEIAKGGPIDSYWVQVAHCDTLQAVGLMHSCASDYLVRGREEAAEITGGGDDAA